MPRKGRFILSCFLWCKYEGEKSQEKERKESRKIAKESTQPPLAFLPSSLIYHPPSKNPKAISESSYQWKGIEILIKNQNLASFPP